VIISPNYQGMLMKRKQHGAKFKFTVALEAAKGTKTVN
jgi:hypothetical protein